MKKSFIAIAAVLFAFASCAEKAVQPIDPSSKTGVTRITATVEKPVDMASRAVLEDNKLTWAVGDSIMVSDGETYSQFVLESVSQDGVASFVLKEGYDELMAGEPCQAWYPVSIAPKNEVSSLVQQQVNTNGEIPEGGKINNTESYYVANPMYAASTTGVLEFKNLCALVKFKVSVPQGASEIAISQIIMQSASKSLFGRYEITDGAAAVLETEPSIYGRIAVRNSNAKWLSAEDEYYLAVPAGTYTDVDFIIQTNRGCFQEFHQKASSELVLERSKIYTLNLVANDIDYINLDACNNHTANCYVASPVANGKYQFKPTRGNSTERIEGIDHVGIVWKAQNSSSKPNLTDKVIKSVSYEKGYIRFETSANQGNAVIAAYDAQNNILWSWHIWLPGTALTDVTLAPGLTILDRNIGGLTNTWSVGSSNNYSSQLSAGNYYQWGRKDPFPGRCNSATVQSFVDGTDMSVATSTASLNESIANPTVFYAATTHWCTDATATWGGETKSVYDPCPYGYRVPSKADFEPVWLAENIAVQKQAAASGQTAITGLTLTAGGVSAWFPTTGQLNNTSGKLGAGTTILNNGTAVTKATDTYSRLWTREADHTFIDGTVRVANGKTIEAATTNTIRFAASANAYGMQVRCVKE